MNDLKDLVAGLPGSVLANLIAGAITAVLTLIFGLRGTNPAAATNIHIDKSTGQRIYAPDNQGSIDASQHQTTTKTTVISKTTVSTKHYGNQADPDDAAGALILCFIGAVLALAATLFVTTLIPALSFLPICTALPVLILAGILLIKNRASYTSQARAKAMFAWFLALGASSQATVFLRASQDTSNPYSLFSIYQTTDQAVQATDGWGVQLIHRALFLLTGDRAFLIAWLIALIALAGLTFIYLYSLQLTLGALLFPASSNGKTFGRALTHANTSFITITWPALTASGVLYLTLPWIASPEGLTFIFTAGSTISTWLQQAITTF